MTQPVYYTENNEAEEPFEAFNAMSIDLGDVRTGIAICTINEDSLSMLSYAFIEFDEKSSAEEKTNKLIDYLNTYIDLYRVEEVVIENPLTFKYRSGSRKSKKDDKQRIREKLIPLYQAVVGFLRDKGIFVYELELFLPPRNLYEYRKNGYKIFWRDRLTGLYMSREEDALKEILNLSKENKILFPQNFNLNDLSTQEKLTLADTVGMVYVSYFKDYD